MLVNEAVTETLTSCVDTVETAINGTSQFTEVTRRQRETSHRRTPRCRPDWLTWISSAMRPPERTARVRSGDAINIVAIPDRPGDREVIIAHSYCQNRRIKLLRRRRRTSRSMSVPRSNKAPAFMPAMPSTRHAASPSVDRVTDPVTGKTSMSCRRAVAGTY